MTLRRARLLRLLTVAGLAGLALLLARLLDPPAAQERPPPRSGEASVREAIVSSTGRPLAVRGYVFEGPGGLGLRLCAARRPGSPPSCIGPFIDLQGVDAGSFALRTGALDGARVRWSEEPVTLLGPVLGTAMTVQHVLR